MRIAFTIERFHPNALGGAEESTRLLAYKLALHGHQVTVFSQDRDFPYQDCVHDLDHCWVGPVRVLPFRWLEKVATRESIRLFHAHSTRAVVDTFAIARQIPKAALVATLRDFSCVCAPCNPWGDCDKSCSVLRCAGDFRRRYGYPLSWWLGFGVNWMRFNRRRKVLAKYNHLVFVSKALRDAAVNHGLRGESSVIYNIPPEYSIPKKFTFCPHVLFAGKKSLGKGAHVLLDAIKIVHKKVPQVRFIIMGRDTAQVSMSKDYRVKDHPHMGIDEVRSCLRNVAWVAVCPSVCREGFSRMVLEAGAAGVPVIVTDRGGSKEGVIHELSGWVIPADNAQVLADTIIESTEWFQRTVNMGKCAKSIMDKQFNPMTLAEQHLRLYERLLR